MGQVVFSQDILARGLFFMPSLSSPISLFNPGISFANYHSFYPRCASFAEFSGLVTSPVLFRLKVMIVPFLRVAASCFIHVWVLVCRYWCLQLFFSFCKNLEYTVSGCADLHNFLEYHI